MNKKSLNLYRIDRKKPKKLIDENFQTLLRLAKENQKT